MIDLPPPKKRGVVVGKRTPKQIVIVWYGMIWHDMAWYGMIWYGPKLALKFASFAFLGILISSPSHWISASKSFTRACWRVCAVSWGNFLCRTVFHTWKMDLELKTLGLLRNVWTFSQIILNIYRKSPGFTKFASIWLSIPTRVPKCMC